MRPEVPGSVLKSARTDFDLQRAAHRQLSESETLMRHPSAQRADPYPCRLRRGRG